ncbi:MAG: hypothetical protein CVU61_17515 [Deltaproteobacteria bacterium HGW-Deltaproteobacteria-19]|nr:MAG: hypothetical protein CVU61_17515 [Deltaproteobacteria bacterium HGW-Deltaproteobacteria-19]
MNEEADMKRNLMLIGVIFVAMLLAWPAMSQPPYGYGPGYGDQDGGPWMGRGMGPGYGMGPGGGMGYGTWGYVPQKLPVPKSKEWVGKLKEILVLERLSLEQYSLDADKYNTYMPYRMVIPQEQDHVMTIERLFAAYGLPAEGKPAALTNTKTLTEAYELCVKMERDLIPRYEWLVKNAEDRDSAGVLNNLLIQTRYHLAMFEHALQVGGGGMGGWGWRGHGPGMMRGW